MSRRSSKEVLIDALDALENQEIPHAYWKASRRLPEALDFKTDFDLLVPPGTRSIWMPLLQERGFFRFRTCRLNELEEMAHLVAFVRDTREFVHVHVHEAPLSGDYEVWEYCLGTADEILKYRYYDPIAGVFRLSPAMEVCLLSLRAFTEPKMQCRKGGLTSRAVADLEYAWSQTNAEEICDVSSSLLDQKTVNLLIELLESKQWPGQRDAFKKLEPTMKTLLPRYMRLPAASQNFARTRRRALGYSEVIYERLRPPTAMPWPRQRGLRLLQQGLFVAVVGPDGAGKSTLIEHLEIWLKEVFDTKRTYLGRGDLVSSAWHGLAKLKWQFISGVAGRQPRQSAGNAPLLGDLEQARASDNIGASDFDVERTPLRQRAWELSRIAQAARQWRKTGQIRWERAQGMVILTDRFPHPEERFGGGPGILVNEEDTRWTRWASKAERFLLRRVAHNHPDIIIRLSISAEDAWKRKPEHHFEDIRRKVQAMERVAWKGAKEHVIDASQPLDDVKRQARQIIWSYLSQ